MPASRIPQLIPILKQSLTQCGSSTETTTTAESSSSTTTTTTTEHQNVQLHHHYCKLTPSDFVVALFHSVMIHLGFRLIGLGEQETITTNTGSANTEGFPQITLLPREWNISHEMYTFKYKHDQSSMTFLLKCMKMMDQLFVHGLAMEDKQKLHKMKIEDLNALFKESEGSMKEIKVSLDVLVGGENTSTTTTSTRTDSSPIASSSLSTTTAAEATRRTITEQENNHQQNEESWWKSILQIEAMDQVLVQFYKEIVDPLMPGVTKEGFEHLTKSTGTQTSTSGDTFSSETTSGRRGYHQPLGRGVIIDPLREYDPYSGDGIGRLPTSVGQADLDPFYASPGLITPGGRFGLPGTGISGYGNYGNFGSGGGMVVGPDHPMFRQPPGSGSGVGGRGPFAPNGRLPPGAVPPGARFDPITPFGPRPGFPPRPSRPTFRGDGDLPFSGEPDNDELPPPGYNNMFM